MHSRDVVISAVDVADDNENDWTNIEECFLKVLKILHNNPNIKCDVPK